MTYEADYFVQAIGHRWAELPTEWAGRVFRAYPCDYYGHKLPPQITVVGAGPAGIEVALHALHNLDVAHVTLVSRRAQARLPAVEPTDVYQCQWLTREKMLDCPTATTAQSLLQQEVEDCYLACNLPYPGWDALINIDNYPAFSKDYLTLTQQCPNHPLAHLVRPVMSFYGQVRDLLSASDRTQLQQFIHRVKPLFATQSRPCAELWLAAIQQKRLTLVAGEFLSHCMTPIILKSDQTQWQPDCVVLATGLGQAPSLVSLAESADNSLAGTQPQKKEIVCYQVTGTSLSSIHQQGNAIATTIVQQLCGSSVKVCQ